MSAQGQLPTNIEIGIIGGSGVYGLEGMSDKQELGYIETPFGKTSSKVMLGTVEGARVAFISRHDTMHRLTPSEVPYKANVAALKMLGVRYVIAVTAVGSLQEQCKPLDMVVIDQFIDRTKSRDATFFGNGVVGHISFGDPVCLKLVDLIHRSISALNLDGVTVHKGGTYVCMEGPAFSTRAESNMYRLLGGTVIGMTALTEAKLCREAEIAYGAISLVTDYDCWKNDHEAVNVEMVVKTFKQNGVNAQLAARTVIRQIVQEKPQSDAFNALAGAIMTRPDHIPEKQKEALKHVMGRYLQ